jgi:hypothetical protein
MKTLLYVSLTIILLLVMVDPGMAQSAPPLPAFPDNPAPAPIDGGLGVLAAAGAAYAYRKLKKKD